ncbi:zinc ribbon domain-containing protein YjdM [Desulfovibrio inopinatus]|uniref:zinc ribbon domain-containing protein YjdM n=1 Tax=Desulfovibrio inopinatus TaxID=102109 RepID=UPI00041C9D90|nr:zinc ribbon domain-containing protein YjdM [Desulfovibrio inopinatus]
METIPNCPQCNCEYVYHDGSMYVCPECALEFQAADAAADAGEKVYKDANGAVLVDGDTVIIMQDLKVKGASGPIKKGTKVKNIKLIEPTDGVHDISCKIPGFGAMFLKTSVVKKG